MSRKTKLAKQEQADALNVPALKVEVEVSLPGARKALEAFAENRLAALDAFAQSVRLAEKLACCPVGIFT